MFEKFSFNSSKQSCDFVSQNYTHLMDWSRQLLPWCWYNIPTELLRNTDRELFLEEAKFGSKLDFIPVHNYC